MRCAFVRSILSKEYFPFTFVPNETKEHAFVASSVVDEGKARRVVNTLFLSSSGRFATDSGR